MILSVQLQHFINNTAFFLPCLTTIASLITTASTSMFQESQVIFAPYRPSFLSWRGLPQYFATSQYIASTICYHLRITLVTLLLLMQLWPHYLKANAIETNFVSLMAVAGRCYFCYCSVLHRVKLYNFEFTDPPATSTLRCQLVLGEVYSWGMAY